MVESVLLKDSDGNVALVAFRSRLTRRHPTPLNAAPDEDAPCAKSDASLMAPMFRGGRAGRLRCAPFIAMVETTDFGDRDDQSGGCYRDRSVIRRVLLEAGVRSTPMIVPTVGREDAPEMRLVDDDHVIETLSSDRADQAFDVGRLWALELIELPGRLHRRIETGSGNDSATEIENGS